MPLRFGCRSGRSVSDPLANDALHRSNSPAAIVEAVSDTVVIPELELGNVGVKVLLAVCRPMCQDRDSSPAHASAKARRLGMCTARLYAISEPEMPFALCASMASMISLSAR